MSDEIRAAVTAKLVELGIAYEAVHVGQIAKDQGVGEKPWDCDQWRITFEKRDPTYHGPRRMENCMQTDFYTGLGQRKSSKVPTRYPSSRYSEHRWETPVKPDAASVLHSLCSDAEALNESFSNWCDNFGYSNDSISALNTYRACEDIGKKLYAFFGREAVQQITEMVREL